MCNRKVKTLAYNTIVRPHLEYASPCWNPHLLKNIDKVESVQRRAAQFVLNDYTRGRSTNLTNRIEQDLKWEPLRYRRAVTDATLFYKIQNGQVNIQFPPYISPQIRHPYKFQHIACHSTIFRFQYFVRTTAIWNQLPKQIISAPSIASFKHNIQTWISPLTWTKDPASNAWILVQSF